MPFLALFAAALLTPAVSELPVPPVGDGVAVAEPAEDPVQDEHNPVVHMALARLAYRFYTSQYAGGELERYVGDFSGDKPPPGHNTVVAGAFEEDKSYQNPFHEVGPVMRHFWDCRLADDRGLAGYDSSVNRAQKYWTGGFGLKGDYDANWSSNMGPLRGTMGRGAVELHRLGEKGTAYWYLGHIAHLVQDLTVPAHAHLWPHPAKLDTYEHYVRDRYPERTTLPSGSVESFSTPYELFRRTGEITLRYDAGVGSGPLRGKDGTVDKGRRRDDGFSEAELQEEGDVLFNLAVRRVAALFVLFYKAVDKTAPVVDLSVTKEGALSAAATDSESGVFLRGYTFQWRAAGETVWKTVAQGEPTARFIPPAPGLYDFRATAVDAAGNQGVSPTLQRVKMSLVPAIARTTAKRRLMVLGSKRLLPA